MWFEPSPSRRPLGLVHGDITTLRWQVALKTWMNWRLEDLYMYNTAQLLFHLKDSNLRTKCRNDNE
jgi:hypothetical protein